MRICLFVMLCGGYPIHFGLTRQGMPPAMPHLDLSALPFGADTRLLLKYGWGGKRLSARSSILQQVAPSPRISLSLKLAVIEDQILQLLF